MPLGRFIVEYIWILMRGIVFVGYRFIKALLSFWRYLPHWEKMVIVGIGLSIVLMFLGWKKYDISFGEGYTYSHKIITDDMFLLLCIKMSIIATIIFLYHSKNENFFLLWLQAGFLIGWGLLYGLNYLFPQRIGNTGEAKLTWQFYGNGVILATVMISGFLGIRSYLLNPKSLKRTKSHQGKLI